MTQPEFGDTKGEECEFCEEKGELEFIGFTALDNVVPTDEDLPHSAWAKVWCCPDCGASHLEEVPQETKDEFDKKMLLFMEENGLLR